MYPVEIYIYSNPKTGSQTLLETFEKNNYITRHLHSSNRFLNNPPVCGFYWTNFLKEKNTIFEWMDFSLTKYNKIYIIDSYRNPIERLISHFFQSEIQKIKNYKNKNIEELIKYFNENLLWKLCKVNGLEEPFYHYNIENFTEFNFKKKYNLKEVDDKVFVKLRFKDINDWNKILSEIFNKDITIYNRNLTQDKDINNLYINFKAKYKVPIKYLISIINDKEFNIYNTTEEKLDYIIYWLNNCE